ncbi:MAG: hypothetical protein K2X11_08785 [Acetobacteraceae bacterium]|nr:hypothetical protein [Acetobacteraceae bacterium]
MTRFATLAAAAALAAGFATPGTASASANACNGRVFVDTVYQNGMGGNQFDYYFHLRNGTGQRLQADVTFSGFPHNARLDAAERRALRMDPYATLSRLKFGSGTNGNIGSQTVRVVYDGQASHGPTIRVRNCRAW